MSLPLELQQRIDMRASAVADAKAAKKSFKTDGPTTLPKLYTGSYGMNNTVNCSALFGTLRTATRLEYVKKTFDATNGGHITYKGPELRQDDKALLLELIHQRRNMFGGEIEFAPTTLCKQMGWADNKESVIRLRACLERLCEGTMRLDKTSTDGAMFHLLSKFRWNEKRWTVELCEDVTNLFPTRHFAFLNIELRHQLVPGVQTWLYDYICSNDCSLVMTYAALRDACGRSDDDAKTFADYVKAALAKLKSLGAIVDYVPATCQHSKKSGMRVTKKATKAAKAD
jgi:hypothetical protein